MYRLLGGIIYSLANSKVLSLNFYPILGEMGTVSDRLAKICRWSPNLYNIMKTGAKSDEQSLNRPEETTAWLRAINDKQMGGRVRLFVHQYVTVPDSVFDASELQQER